MCYRKYGARYARILSVLLLLSVLSLPIYSDEADSDQTIAELLTRLEATTNELESATNLLAESRTLIAEQNSLIQTQRTLSNDLMTQLSERDERLETIGSLWTEYAASRRREITIATIKGIGVGIGVASVVYTVTAMFF